MQWFRQQLAAAGRRMSALDTTARLLMGSLLVVLALSIFLVAQYAGTTDLVPLAVNASARDEARRFLTERGERFEVSGEKILVPAARQSAIISEMGEKGIGGNEAIDFDALIALDNPFETMRQSEQKKLVALQNVLARTINGFKGVKGTTVVIAPRPQTGLGVSSIPQSAAVHVTMKGNEGLTQAQVDAIAALVAGTQAGLKVENVAISDSEGPRRPRGTRDRLAGENLEHQQKVAESVRERIQGLLSNIPGVLIAVNPQVVTKTMETSDVKYGEAASAPTRESSLETSTKGATPAETPGARPNTGMQIDPARTGSSATTEKRDSTFETRIPSTMHREVDPTGYAVKIDVGVAVPWSYFRKVWELKNSASAGTNGADTKPDEAAIGKVRDDEIERIRKLLDTQIQTDAKENSKKGNVEVTWFYDFDGSGFGGGLGGGSGGGGGGFSSSGPGLIEAISPGTTGGSLVKTIALGGLALLSLGMMLMMVRKSADRPDLPTPNELAGIPPALETDESELVGEADESSPPLEGLELNDTSLKNQQMLTQLNDMVKAHPQDSAALLRRWMRSNS